MCCVRHTSHAFSSGTLFVGISRATAADARSRRKEPMSNDTVLPEEHRQQAEGVREKAEGGRQHAEREREIPRNSELQPSRRGMRRSSSGNSQRKPVTSGTST